MSRLGLYRLGQWLEWASLLCSFLVLAACIAFFVYQALPWLLFPADLLTWSEPGFVGNVMKLSQGRPIYGPPEQSNSVIYTPGAPILTYALLRFADYPISVPALRVVQSGFVALATVVAALGTHQLRRLVVPRRPRHETAWTILGLMVLFLAATSPQVNRLVLTLHADALALAVSMVAWLGVVSYVRTPSRTKLVLLACLPAAGFAVKQFLLFWLPVTAVVLLLLPFRSRKHHITTLAAYVALAAFLLIGVIVAFERTWGNNFTFWVFEIMGGDRKRITLFGEFNISLFRSADHVFRAWWELGLGVASAWWVVRRSADQRLIALFVGWLVLIGFEALTSGSGWSVLYHFGPAVLIGTTWLLAALPVWAGFFEESPDLRPEGLGRALRAGTFVVVTLSICIGLRVLPTRDPTDARWFPGRPPTPELLAQVHRIEQEFDGLHPSEVLVDLGNWVYLPSGFIALDRADALGDQPLGGHYENFAPLLQRIRSRRYRKIMVRSLHERAFLYDWWRWRKSSGVREALMANYREAALVPGTRGLPGMYDGAVSILVPKDER